MLGDAGYAKPQGNEEDAAHEDVAQGVVSVAAGGVEFELDAAADEDGEDDGVVVGHDLAGGLGRVSTATEQVVTHDSHEGEGACHVQPQLSPAGSG